jgi:hypothetical protein
MIIGAFEPNSAPASGGVPSSETDCPLERHRFVAFSKPTCEEEP